VLADPHFSKGRLLVILGSQPNNNIKKHRHPSIKNF
jgi:hypothetical protein